VTLWAVTTMVAYGFLLFLVLVAPSQWLAALAALCDL
jgi:hypothetical protein